MPDNDNKKPWFTNKDLYILIGELQKEMTETRTIIKRYNGLYTKLSEVKKDTDDTKADVDQIKSDVHEIRAKSRGRQSVANGIRAWGGWVISIIMMLIALAQFL